MDDGGEFWLMQGLGDIEGETGENGCIEGIKVGLAGCVNGEDNDGGKMKRLLGEDGGGGKGAWVGVRGAIR